MNTLKQLTFLLAFSPTKSLPLSKIKPILETNLSKMQNVMTSSFFNSSPPLKQLRSQCIKSIEVKPSSIPGAGLGLFAKKNIKASTIISFYPVHALGTEMDEEIWVYNDDEYFRDNPPSQSSYLHATDQPIFKRTSILTQEIPECKDIPTYLDCNPNQEYDALWASQYINDGAILTSNDEEGINTYYQNSKQKKNCIHVPFGPSPIMATITTKKVKKGEELFTSYGAVYWLGVLFDNTGPDMTTKIQGQIRESAQDLFVAMRNVEGYKSQCDALIEDYNGC